MRFSLKTLFLITFLAAIGAWWYARFVAYPINVVHLPDGSRLLTRQRLEKVGGDAVWMPTGPVVLLGPDGRIVFRGEVSNGIAVGNWTLYHANGRRAVAGPAQHDVRTGVWTAWYESGTRRAVVTHEPPVPNPELAMIPVVSEARPLVPPGIQAQMQPPSSFQFPGAYGSPLHCPSRSGPANEYWENGRRKATGTYSQDARDGTWQLFDSRGRRLADIDFRNGLANSGP